MNWIYFVILATLCWATANIMDKFLIDKRINKPLTLTIFIRATSAIPLLLIIPFVGFSLPSTEFVLWIVLASILAVIGLIIYYKAIQIEEISRIIPLYQFLPVFVLFLSFFFLGEILGFFDYLGFVVLIIGGIVITTKSSSKIIRVEKAFWFILLSSFFYAISAVIMKYVLGIVEYWNAFILLWAVQLIAILSLLASRRVRKDAKQCIKIIDIKDKILILFNSILSLLAFVFSFFAIKLGSVTLVEAAQNMQMAFTFLLALFFTKSFPHILREKFDKKTTSQKIVGMILIITGVLFTQMF